MVGLVKDFYMINNVFRGNRFCNLLKRSIFRGNRFCNLLKRSIFLFIVLKPLMHKVPK